MARYDDIKKQMETLIESVEEVTGDHESIKASDEQYDDPELWWAGPLLKNLISALKEMEET